MSGVEAMIREAEKSLGLREPNHIQEWYEDRNGPAYNYNFPWCNAAVTYWAVRSGNHPSVCFNTDYAYTVYHANRFASAGAWHSDIAGIRRGDIVFFDWGGSDSRGAIDHVGIVTSVSGGTVYTIEGNTADVCARRVRYASTIAGYGRPNYGGPSKPGAPARYRTTINGLSYGYGAKGDHVLRVQKALAARGFKKGTGKTWGDDCTRAYAKWQRHLGYSGNDADGVPGASSLGELLGSLPKPSRKAKPKVDLSRLRTAARHNPPQNGAPVTYSGVKTVEAALVKGGYLSKRYADGHYGTTTVDAYARWQHKLGYRGRDADGIPGMASLKALGKKYGFTVIS